MASSSKKIRLEAMIESPQRTLAGGDSAGLNVSSQNDGLDKLAETIYTLLKKTKSSFPQPTESGKIEDRYLAILKRMQESYFETDIQGNFIFFSNRGIRDLGYTADEIRGSNFRKILDQEKN